MTEVYTEYSGRLLRLSDEAFEDFSGDINTAKTLHEARGLGRGALREHADDLRTIGAELSERLVGDETNNGGFLWTAAIGLWDEGGESGASLADAYSYMRVNRLLDVEFGPDETSTTQLLRRIALDEVADITRNHTRGQVDNFFHTNFGSTLLGKFFSANGAQIHSDIAKHVVKSADEWDVFNPALARVVSTLLAGSSEVTFDIADDFRVELFLKNLRIFKDKKMRTQAVKEVTVSWAENPSAVSDIGEPTVNSQVQIVKHDSLEDDIEAPDLTFNPKLAACYVDRTKVKDPELYESLRKYVMSIMFPGRGVSTRPAKELCESCRVKNDCLEFALNNGVKHGFWGGESERGRRRIRSNAAQEISVELSDQ